METENEVVAVNGGSMTASGESESTKSGTETYIFMISQLLLKAPLTTTAGNILRYFFLIIFQGK